jgi:hypothetical protein
MYHAPQSRPDARQPVSSRKLVEVTARIVGVQNFEDSPTVAKVYVIRAFQALTQMSAMAIYQQSSGRFSSSSQVICVISAIRVDVDQLEVMIAQDALVTVAAVRRVRECHAVHLTLFASRTHRHRQR